MCVLMPFMCKTNLKMIHAHCEICDVKSLKDLEKLIKHFKINAARA